MFQAETVSGLWRANSGFCTMLDEAVQRAAPRISSAPWLSAKPSPSPNAISPMPANEMMVPSHAIPEKRSPRNSIASTAVKIGLPLMMKLAGPAETVSSPKLSSTV